MYVATAGRHNSRAKNRAVIATRAEMLGWAKQAAADIKNDPTARLTHKALVARIVQLSKGAIRPSYVPGELRKFTDAEWHACGLEALPRVRRM